MRGKSGQNGFSAVGFLFSDRLLAVDFTGKLYADHHEKYSFRRLFHTKTATRSA